MAVEMVEARVAAARAAAAMVADCEQRERGAVAGEFEGLLERKRT